MSFSDILGHERQIEVLKRSIRAGQLPPAYLFHGDEGTGKRMVAVELAKAVNCTGGAGPDGSCGICQPCRNIGSGCHPNVRTMEIEANPDTGKLRQEIVIDQVRAAQEALFLRAVGEGRKVLIVDGAHLMNEEAMNAFLKTLEEPPQNSHVVLVTSQPNRLLATILSRCRALSFMPLPEDTVADILKKRRGMSPEDASLVARLTGGRVGEALGADPGELKERRGRFLEMLGFLAQAGPSDVLKKAEAASKKDEGLEEFVLFGTMWFRDLLVILVGGEPAFAYNRDMAGELSGWAGRVTEHGCLEALALLGSAGREMTRTFNRRLIAEALFFRLKEEVLA